MRPDALRDEAASPATLRELGIYFLRLGTFGFGGPIALGGFMQRDLVESRHWLTEEEFKEGLALAQLMPGPLAAQVAIYIGWVRGGLRGATLTAAAFVAPSFVMVLALAWLYVRFGGLPWMQAVFYGVGAAVIAVIATSVVKLSRMALAKDKVSWAIAIGSAVVTAWTESEIIWLFLASGVVMMIARGKLSLPKGPTALAVALPAWITTGVKGVAGAATLGTIAWYFAEAGTFVFGSGLAIVPFLRAGVVEQLGWLNDRQFLDAVAVAMITPGPVVITVAFIGYLVAGPAGAVVAGLATFLPCYLLTVLPARRFRTWSANPKLKAFVDGVTAAATGAIAGAGFVLGRRAIVDFTTAAIALLALGLLVFVKRLKEPVVVAIAAALGLALARGGA